MLLGLFPFGNADVVQLSALRPCNEIFIGTIRTPQRAFTGPCHTESACGQAGVKVWSVSVTALLTGAFTVTPCRKGLSRSLTPISHFLDCCFIGNLECLFHSAISHPAKGAGVRTRGGALFGVKVSESKEMSRKRRQNIATCSPVSSILAGGG